VLLPAWMPDWRWLADRADTPWYPGVMRLFRQRHDGDWDTVVAEAADVLAGLLAR
jgi:predicted esterase